MNTPGPPRCPGEDRWRFQIVREMEDKDQKTVVWTSMSRDVRSFMEQLGVLDGDDGPLDELQPGIPAVVHRHSLRVDRRRHGVRQPGNIALTARGRRQSMWAPSCVPGTPSLREGRTARAYGSTSSTAFGLAHRRLSVIGMSASGAQPMGLGLGQQPVRPGTHRASAGRAGNGQPPLPVVVASPPAWGRRSHRRRSHLLLGGGAVPLNGLRFHDGHS